MNTEKKVIIGVALLTMVILGGGVWWISSQGAREQAKLTRPLVGEAIPDQGANHIPAGQKVDYNSNPPTSGPHYATSQPAGIYDKEIPDGYLIHSMEHGAVILWYKSGSTENQAGGTESAKVAGLSSQEIDRLKQIFNSVPVRKKIMVPRAGLDTLLALTSWDRLLKLQTIDENQIRSFMESNDDRGPEKAPI